MDSNFFAQNKQILFRNFQEQRIVFKQSR